MALINCKECGKEISDSAKSCPNCGCSTELGKKTAQLKGLSTGVVVALLLSLVGLFLFFTSVGPMLEGIDDHGFFGWFSKHEDEAFGIFIKFCFGLGMSIGGAMALLKVKRQADYLVPRKDDFVYDEAEYAAAKQIDYSTYATDTWTCSCGRKNASYVSTCACGVNKRDCKK